MPFLIYKKGKGNNIRTETVEYYGYYNGTHGIYIYLDKDTSYYKVFDVRNKYLGHLRCIKK